MNRYNSSDFEEFSRTSIGVKWAPSSYISFSEASDSTFAMASAQPVEAVDLFWSRQDAYPSSSRFDIAADTFDLGLAGSDAILQRISRGQDVRCSFLEFERTFRTNLIFVGLHAIDCAALAWRHIATVFLDVVSARSFELFDPGIQLAMVAMKNLNMTNFLNITTSPDQSRSDEALQVSSSRSKLTAEPPVQACAKNVLS